MPHNLKNAKKILPLLLISTLVACQNIDSQTSMNETKAETNEAEVKAPKQESSTQAPDKEQI